MELVTGWKGKIILFINRIILWKSNPIRVAELVTGWNGNLIRVVELVTGFTRRTKGLRVSSYWGEKNFFFYAFHSLGVSAIFRDSDCLHSFRVSSLFRDLDCLVFIDKNCLHCSLTQTVFDNQAQGFGVSTLFLQTECLH